MDDLGAVFPPMELPVGSLSIWDDITQYVFLNVDSEQETVKAATPATTAGASARAPLTVPQHSGVKRTLGEAFGDHAALPQHAGSSVVGPPDALPAADTTAWTAGTSRSTRRRTTKPVRVTPAQEAAAIRMPPALPPAPPPAPIPPMVAKNKWGCRGVRYDHNKKARPWEVKMSMNGKDKSLGYYETKEEAAIQYDIHTIQHRGVGVRHKLNFPDHPRVRSELEKSLRASMASDKHAGVLRLPSMPPLLMPIAHEALHALASFSPAGPPHGSLSPSPSTFDGVDAASMPPASRHRT